jgi:hypothetical protein
MDITQTRKLLIRLPSHCNLGLPLGNRLNVAQFLLHITASRAIFILDLDDYYVPREPKTKGVRAPF